MYGRATLVKQRLTMIPDIARTPKIHSVVIASATAAACLLPSPLDGSVCGGEKVMYYFFVVVLTMCKKSETVKKQRMNRKKNVLP